MTELDKIDEVFTYHKPKTDDIAKYQDIRDAAKNLAFVVLKNTPKCADQSFAIRLIREAVMTANAAIALDGLV